MKNLFFQEFHILLFHKFIFYINEKNNRMPSWRTFNTCFRLRGDCCETFHLLRGRIPFINIILKYNILQNFSNLFLNKHSYYLFIYAFGDSHDKEYLQNIIKSAGTYVETSGIEPVTNERTYSLCYLVHITNLRKSVIL